jgi:hypothetical protein
MQTSIEWLIEQLNTINPTQIEYHQAIEHAKKLHKIEIMKAYSKQSPIEDGVFTSVNKAEQYYNQTFINE